jgi:Mitochondrial 18 KDa protein (MTP18)
MLIALHLLTHCNCKLTVILNVFLYDKIIISLMSTGYANEVGESFRALIHVNWVRFSYGVASSYVCADAASKGSGVYKVSLFNLPIFEIAI